MNYTEIDQLKNELDKYRNLFQGKVSKAFDIEYTHESNKIEGNTLTLQETAIVVEKGLTIEGIDKDNAGRYRSVPVMILGSEHMPPQPFLLQKEMEEMMRFYNENRETMHPVELASEMHQRLVYIHPFTDGNGRTSRLLMNLILLKHGYPIAILKGDAENRLKYYTALETASIEKDLTPFKTLIAEVVTQTLKKIISTVKG